MRRSQRQPRRLRDENFILPDSSEESNADDSDEDPNYNPVDAGKKRLEIFLSKGNTNGKWGLQSFSPDVCVCVCRWIDVHR